MKALRIMFLILFSGPLVVACRPLQAPTSVPVRTSAPTAAQTTPAQTLSQSQLITETIAAPSLANNLLKEPAERPIAVYLPPSYSTSSQKYPVVYYLPGFDDDVPDMLYGRYFSLQQSLDKLIQEGATKEMIIVIASGKNLLGASFYVNSPVTGNWEDFIVKDLVQHVDSHYRTLPRADARGMSGHSVGGFGALNLAMRHPEVFGAVYSLSPAIFDRDGLANSPLFSPPSAIEEFLKTESTLAAMSKPAANQQLQELKATDPIAPSLDDFLRRFPLAYGEAFSPNPNKNAPYIDYPYRKGEGNLILDEALLKVWANGLGGIAEAVPLYKDNWLRLKAIAFEYGRSDDFPWIPQGCEYLSQQLDAARVPHQSIPFEGDHMSQLRQRIEEHMLPFFSQMLASAAA